MESISYVSQKIAQKIDLKLFNESKLPLLIAMELAGQSAAFCIKNYSEKYLKKDLESSLIIVGPGNNGGDGCVIARHLHHFQVKKIDLVLLKDRDENNYLLSSVKKLKSVNVYHLSQNNQIITELLNKFEYQLIVDSIFGFSFKGPTIRQPYRDVLGRE